MLENLNRKVVSNSIPIFVKCFLVFLIFLIFPISTYCKSNPRKVKVGAFNYYPAIFKDKDGTIKGFYVEALTEIEIKENIKFIYVYGTWQQCLERIKNKEIDVLPSAAKTKDRLKYLDFTNTQLLTVWGELYVPLSSSIDGIIEIHEKKVAVMKGDYNADFFKSLMEKIHIECIFVEYPGFEEIFEAIDNKKVDAGVVNNSFGVAKCREYDLRSSGVVFNPFDIYFAVKRGYNQDVLEILESYLKSWKSKKNSVFNLSRQKWSHGNLGNIEVFPKWLKIALFSLGILLVIFLAFILILRKEVEKATRNINEQKEILRSNEEKFRGFVNHSPIGIFLMNENGFFIDVNPSACSLSGYSREELLERSFSDLCPEECFKNRNLKFSGTTQIANKQLEVKRKGNVKIWWQISVIQLSEKLFLCYSNDIDQQKKDELLLKSQHEKIIQQNEELKIAKEKAEESDRLKSYFLQNMSHEIRTPLNAIMGFSELLPSYFNDKEKLQKFSTIIKQRGADLIEIISDILDLSKIEAGQLPLKIEVFAIKQLILELESFFKEYNKRINKEQVQFELQFDKKLESMYFKSDPVKIKQIIINLIGNAFKFTHAGKVSLHITYSETNQELTFSVSDTGIGIPEDKHQEIFERFRQVSNDTSRNYGGTGLGLSIVKGLLDLLEGTIGLDSCPGEGSTFHFTIPGKLKTEMKGFKENTPSYLNEKVLNANILLVEDDFFNQEFLKEILINNGLHIECTESGEEAVEICKSKQIQLVLMDIRIKGLQGIEAIQEIKLHKPEIKIIAQTAHASNHDKENAINAGADDFISKPINKNLLLEKIQKAMNV